MSEKVPDPFSDSLFDRDGVAKLAFKMFLADEHPVVRLGIKALLQSEPDLQVIVEVDDEQEAVLQVERLKPDVLLRGLNGLDAASQIG